MTAITDPARELADLCLRLQETGRTDPAGAEFLARKLKVPEWSAEFYALIFAIARRVEDLRAIVETLDIDDDVRAETLADLDQIAQAFTRNGLNNNWSHSLKNYLSPTQVKPLRTLSQFLRNQYPTPRLEDAEREELLSEVDKLLGWLNDQQLADQDFVRQALVEGLTQFRHRLERLEWVGWGYTLQSMRDVIGAYLALERGLPPQDLEPTATVIVKRVGALIAKVYEKVHLAKGVLEAGDTVLRLYGMAALMTQGPSAIVALLPQAGHGQ